MPHIMYLVLQITKLHHVSTEVDYKRRPIFFLQKNKKAPFLALERLKSRMVIGCKLSFVNNDSGLWKPMKEQTF